MPFKQCLADSAAPVPDLTAYSNLRGGGVKNVALNQRIEERRSDYHGAPATWLHRREEDGRRSAGVGKSDQHDVLELLGELQKFQVIHTKGNFVPKAWHQEQ